MTEALSTTAEPELASRFSFNLWDHPWITALGRDGARRQLGIADCLLEAHELGALLDPSPLVVAGLQRLLAAIAQDIYQPESIAELARLLAVGRFEPEAIQRFGLTYRHRFDLFSETEPFLQSGDIPRDPPKQASATKPVGYLFADVPTATNINHFDHRWDDREQYSPAAAARGLVTLPAFATSGGSGIKPSINGVPPLYVLPAGETLFQTLVLSIITPSFRPEVAAAPAEDRPAWRREPRIERGREVFDVGYLESLTFPARRVRLIPETGPGVCSRSGELSQVLVRRMVFEMGHWRDKGSHWFDPFASYRLRQNDLPVPVRPVEGRALWREYANLFHVVEKPGASEVRREGVVMPRVVAQTIELVETCSAASERGRRWRFRCIGLRTDMKAKVFEWVDETLEVPTGILLDQAGEIDVSVAILRAQQWGDGLLRLHRQHYGAERDRFQEIRERMRRAYWTDLSDAFRRYIDAAAQPSGRDEALVAWTGQLFRVGEEVLQCAADETGWRGERLRQAAELMAHYRRMRAIQQKEFSQ